MRSAGSSRAIRTSSSRARAASGSGTPRPTRSSRATRRPSVNPSLWRQAKLNGLHGLFEVAEGIYQVRGYDISNLTLIRGKTGWILVDPLTSQETAAAALALARKHLGAAADRRRDLHAQPPRSLRRHRRRARRSRSAAKGSVRIVAPRGFIEEATSENVLAGVAMGRRATFMYGTRLPRDARGHVDTGLGKTPARGTIGLREPTELIDHTPQEMTLDGVRFVFQYAPDSEAPAELTFYLPDAKACCGAEIVSHTLHNLYTLRGAKVRDALRWSGYIDEAIDALRRRRGRVREPSLAGVGPRARRRLSEEAARHLPLHPRPDAAAREPGPDAAGDRGADRAARVAGVRLRRPRLLRHAAAQREGGLPVLLRLVRREPGEPRSPAAGRGGRPLRRGDGRRRRGAPQGAGRLRPRRVSLGRDAAEPPGVRRPGRRRGARAAGARLRPARLPGGVRALARRLPERRLRAAPRHAVRRAGPRLRDGHAAPRAARSLLRVDGRRAWTARAPPASS